MAPAAVLCRPLLAFVFALSACGGGNVAEHRATVTRFLPATLESFRRWEGEVRTAKVRIYADAQVRALPRWKDDIAEEVDYASQVLQPLAGVRLAIDSFKDWERTGKPEDALRELTELDKADGVTWVLGYVAPTETTTAVMSALGDARTLGHHVTVRAWAAGPETESLAGRVPDPKDPERAEVINAHHRHKQTVVLLHMLATTLGAIAEVDPTWIQHPTYSAQQDRFSNRNAELLQLAIGSRLNGDADPDLAKKLDDAIEKAEWGGWVPADHDQVIATLHNAVTASRAGKTFANVPSAAFDEVRRISELAKQGQTADALIELDNLLTAYPGNAAIHELKCEIMLAKPGVTDKTTRAACARVTELAPGDPTVHLAVAEALIRAGDIAGARAELSAAEGKIANLTTGATEAWRRVISVYLGIGSLTWTEEALAKARLENDPAAVSIGITRARYGIPRGAKFVVPGEEVQLIGAIRGALDLIYATKYGPAEKAIAAAEKKWPGAPGLIAARCDLAYRLGQFEAARASCTRALAADAGDSWALYLLGTLLLRDAGTTGAGIEKLKRAIAVDPDLGQAWRTLARAYERGHDKAAYEQLSAAYQTKFGQSLPR